MSRTISFEITFHSNNEISAIALLEFLANIGWNPIVNGKINHLPIDDMKCIIGQKKRLLFQNYMK